MRYPSWVPVFPSAPLERAMQVLGYTDAALTALDDGCDAIVIESVGDYGLTVINSILPVPVFGPGLLGLAEASRHGRRFGIVTVWPESMNFILAERLAAARCENLCVGIVNIGSQQDLTTLSGPQGYLTQVENAESMIVEKVQAGIASLVAAGSEAVMLGCTCMTGLANIVSPGAGVPIINPLIIAIDAARTSEPLGSQPQLHRKHRQLLRAMVDAVAHEQIESCNICVSGTAPSASDGS